MLDGRSLVFLGAVLVTRLHLELPGWLHTVADGPLKLILIRLLLLILFHGEDVVEEPLKDSGVTVDRDVDLVIVGDFLEAAVEVLHVLDEQAARERKVSLFVLAIVDHMNHDAVFELKVLTLKHFEATFAVGEAAE